MKGVSLALGAVTALALAGRARGSAARAPVDLPSPDARVLTPHGFPWPSSTPLWHATTGYRSLLKTGFKTRGQIASQVAGGQGRAVHAVGGGTDSAISFSCDYRVCEAILVGLGALRRGARGELTLDDLWNEARVACPRGAAAAWQMFLKEGWTKERQDRLVDGWILVRSSATPRKLSDLPPGAQVRTTWFRALHPGQEPVTDWDRNADTNIAWDYWRPASKEERQDIFASHYKAILAMGESEKECYDPVFFLSNMDAIGALSEADLGIVEVRTRVPRIVMEGRAAIQLGYLDRPQAYRYEEVLRAWNHEAVRALDAHPRRQGRYWDPDNDAPARFSASNYYNLRSGDEVGPFVVQFDDQPWSGRTSLVALGSMAEVRGYAPDLCSVVPAKKGASRKRGTESGHEFFARVGRGLFRPYFVEMEGLKLPGEVRS